MYVSKVMYLLRVMLFILVNVSMSFYNYVLGEKGELGEGSGIAVRTWEGHCVVSLDKVHNPRSLMSVPDSNGIAERSATSERENLFWCI